MVLTALCEATAVIVMKAYLSVAEIANVTKKKTILRWIKAGRFGCVRKVGNEFRIPHESFLTPGLPSTRPVIINPAPDAP